MIEIIVFCATILLPLGWIVRDWKLTNKSTKKYRGTTITLVVLWFILAGFSTFYFSEQDKEEKRLQANVGELIVGKNEQLKKTSELTAQIEKYQQELQVKDERIIELEKQARVIRSVEGKIECIITSNWKNGKHPGDVTPITWDKANPWAVILEENKVNDSRLKFILQSLKFKKLSEKDLKITLEVNARHDGGAIGQPLETLYNYDLLVVCLPHIYKSQTADGIITLKRLSATFVVNKDRKAKIEYGNNYNLVFLKDKQTPCISLGKSNLLHDIFVR